MRRSLTVITIVGTDERHRVVTYDEGGFSVCSPQSPTDEPMNAEQAEHALLSPFERPGPSFIALVEHDDDTFELGFIARRAHRRWVDVTAPVHPREILWQDIVTELRAEFTRLIHCHALACGPAS